MQAQPTNLFHPFFLLPHDRGGFPETTPVILFGNFSHLFRYNLTVLIERELFDRQNKTNLHNNGKEISGSFSFAVI